MIRYDVTLGNEVIIYSRELVNLYGCDIGDNCKIANFVEIQDGVKIGSNSKIEAFAFIPSGVVIGSGVFIGPHVCFTNDKYPQAVNLNGELLKHGEWTLYKTVIKDNVSIGANSTILCGITIGEGAIIGAGSVVTKNVLPGSKVFGNPARKR
jgi:acetyltransferase-like isoleucine patch superfamily enzyme